MLRKLLAAITALMLVSLASVAAFASQDAIDNDDNETPAAASRAGSHVQADGVHGIPDDNPSHQPDAGGDCDKGETAIMTTPAGNEVMVPCHASANTRGAGDENSHQDEVHGIPADNPSHQPDAGGACDKGETAVMTTPGGIEVTVPCHAADGEHGSGENSHHDDLRGIPNDNPSHQADAGAACDRGETAIVTTPGGARVTVPCHAAANDHRPD